MDKNELLKLLNEIEQSAKHKSIWGRSNCNYYKGVLDCVAVIRKALGV